jgi:hypothetical protein
MLPVDDSQKKGKRAKPFRSQVFACAMMKVRNSRADMMHELDDAIAEVFSDY